jgi:membrane associated rhomboid family serine protease
VRDQFGRVRWAERPMPAHYPCPIPVRWTLLTSMFLHGSWMHLLGNMLYLWIVGDNVEEVLGPIRYLIVYLACGLAGSMAQIAVNPDSKVPTLGASGAIAGLMGAYVVWFPHHQIRVLVFRFITVLPAVIVIGGWIALQIWLGAGSIGRAGESGGVAYLAHVGGAVTGIFVAFLFYDRANYVKSRNAAAEGWSDYEGPE